VGKEKELVVTIKCRKLQYVKHIMRYKYRYDLLQRILQGKIDGKRSLGRRRLWIANNMV
jgi:hypothetical protein